MVIKQSRNQIYVKPQFESSVISYGNQTSAIIFKQVIEFESSVISYGNQTKATRI